jgi:hypothetical protein
MRGIGLNLAAMAALMQDQGRYYVIEDPRDKDELEHPRDAPPEPKAKLVEASDGRRWFKQPTDSDRERLAAAQTKRDRKAAKRAAIRARSTP